MNEINNIFASIPNDIHKELFQDILTMDDFKIERIISQGHSSSDGFWYDQDKNEWVILLKGSAGLMFEGKDDIVELKPGDYLNIPAHLKHRVEWTDIKTETVWIAIFY